MIERNISSESGNDGFKKEHYDIPISVLLYAISREIKYVKKLYSFI